MNRSVLLIFGIVFGLATILFSEVQAPCREPIKKWETEPVFKVPESVIFDEERNILYVSNINGKPTEKNGEGFISKVSPEGKVEKLKWITGLNAPKGSGIFQDKLYVADIDRLVVINIPAGKIMTVYEASGAQFLNDVTIDEEGSVYVSDSSSANSAIYRLKNKKFSVWIQGKGISRPNGLYAERNRLIVGNSGDGKLKAISWNDKTIKTIAEVGSGIDGIAAGTKGNYFMSDWSGKTSVVDATGKVSTLFDTTSSGINSADITYNKRDRVLIIPTFFDNRLMAYEVEKE